MPKTIAATVTRKSVYTPIQSVVYFPEGLPTKYYVTLRVDKAALKQLKEGQAVSIVLLHEEGE